MFDFADSQRFLVSRMYLAHAVLAHLSPELIILDKIISLQSCGTLRVAASHAQTFTLVSLPPELLLIVRSHLHRSIISTLISSSAHALSSALIFRAREFCTNCLAYNVDVYGEDVLNWPILESDTELGAGCRCGMWDVGGGRVMVQEWRQRERELEVNIGAHFTLDTRDRIFGVRIPNNRISPLSSMNDITPTNHSLRAPQHMPHAWLENRLSRLAPGGRPIWDVVAEVLKEEADCELVCRRRNEDDVELALERKRDGIDIILEQDTSWIISSPSSSAPRGAEQRDSALCHLARTLALPTFCDLDGSPGSASRLIKDAQRTSAEYIASRTDDVGLGRTRARTSTAIEVTRTYVERNILALVVLGALCSFTLALTITPEWLVIPCLRA